jgi:glycosyltransferase involved in cell wall biosynthesis
VLRFVFLGRLHPIKGIENLIDAFARFSAAPGRRASLVVAGGGDPAYVSSLAARARDLGVADRVSMPGSVDEPAKRDLFARSDVLVVPSFRESFGIVVAEALAHEVPVIAARGTPWKRLEDEGAGLWVDNDPASLAAAMDRIAGMPLAEMGRRGRAWAVRELSWDLAAERTTALYGRLVEAQRGGSG